MDRVVQRQRMIPFPPAIADARPLLDHQRIDTELIEPRGDREPRLGGTDHEDRRLPIFVGTGLAAYVRPVIAAEIPRIGGAGWAVGTDFLLVSVQRLQRCGQEPRFHRATGVGRQADDAGAATVAGVEFEDGLDAVDAEAGFGARFPAAFWQMKTVRFGALLLGREPGGDGVRTLLR